MANPFTIGGGTQISANAALVDVVLAPAGGRRAAMRRHLLLNPWSAAYVHFAGLGPMGGALAQMEQMLRIFRRWVIGRMSAALGIYEHGEGA